MAERTFGDRLDRRILKKGFRDGWPLFALRIIEARRSAAHPLQQLTFRRQAGWIIDGSHWEDFIPRESGYTFFSSETFGEVPKIVAACEDVYARHENEIENMAVNKAYFFNLLTEDDLRRHPVLVDFALSKAVTEAVTGYFGYVPRFHSLGVFYSAVSDTIDGSQMYHVDGDSLNQIKCFINVWNVTTGCGGFTFIPRTKMTTTLRSRGLLKTLSDDDVFRLVPEENTMMAEGPPGSGLFVDTSRCLHQGSRAREHPRLIFQFQYVSRPDSLLAHRNDRKVGGGHLLVSRKLLEGIELSNPNAMTFVD